MLNWIRLRWKALQAKRNYPKFELEKAFLEAETMGCRDSAETLERGCRHIWQRFGWWSFEASTAVVRLHNCMFVVIGDRDRAAMVAIGCVSYAVRIGQDPKDFLPRASGILVQIAARGLHQTIDTRSRSPLALLFHSIVRDLRMRDEGLPTAERVLIWVARTEEHGTW